MEAIATESGISLDDHIVRIYQWMRVDEIVDAWPNIKIDPYLETRNLWLTHDRPASTAIGITDMHAPGNRIKIDWVANAAPKKETVTDRVPVPLAGYSQAVTSAGFVWLAGDTGTDWIGDEHTALHPDARVHRNIWYGQKPYNETKYVMAKQRVVLEAAGCSLEDVVKAEVYLAYPDDYFYFERAWRELFPTRPPARSIYTNIGLGLRGSRVEIALIAVKPGSSLDIQVVDTPRARRPFGHEPQAIKAGDLLFVSGQMACDEHGLPLAQPESDFPHLRRAARTEMQLIVDNLAAICDAAGTSVENVCRRQAVYTDMNAFEATWDVWRSAFRTLPAENTLGVTGRQLSLGCTLYADIMVYAP
jgi:enamine deaminase RidA (YjgF/YER057c/UK114 family)